MENKNTETIDNLLLQLKKKEEEMNGYLLHLEWIIGTISVISFIIILLTATYFILDYNVPLAVALIIIAFLILFFGVYHALKIEKDAGYYECRHCHHRYIPSMSAVFKAPHIGRTRYMRCPSCG